MDFDGKRVVLSVGRSRQKTCSRYSRSGFQNGTGIVGLGAGPRQASRHNGDRVAVAVHPNRQEAAGDGEMNMRKNNPFEPHPVAVRMGHSDFPWGMYLGDGWESGPFESPRAHLFRKENAERLARTKPGGSAGLA